MIDLSVISFAVFIVVIAALIIIDRKKVKLQGIVLIRRTKRGRDFIDKTANRHSFFFKKWAIAGVAVAIFLLVFGTFFLLTQTYGILSGQTKEGGVRLLLPGPVSQPVNVPGIFVVPWWIWVIGVAIVMIPHEFMHGIICRLEKIRIQSVGWLLLVVIPGAFVEPDEKQLKKAKRSTKLKIYAAGSFANVMVGLFILLISFLVFTASATPAGIYVKTIEGSPANISELKGAIIELDGKKITNINELSDMLAGKKPGDTIEVKTAQNNYVVPALRSFMPDITIFSAPNETKTYRITLAENEGKAFLGVTYLTQTYYSQNAEMLASILILLIWMYIFSIGIGIVNLLPIKPLDGGLIFEEIAGKFTKRSLLAAKIVTALVLCLLVFNLVGPIFVG